MSDFVVSARKYRPSTFASVVGQEALTTTLKNAIQKNKLSHAYLFCGPRGVGKTSCARIFAKTINCQNRTPEGEACNECDSCVAANEGRSLNIFELDAASNNSVDNIRQITEQVYVAPTEGKYRVYIIDEVHMLSSSAFNAFLKTLEEPPSHAIFILATTEKHKVLPTIISRCQVHDFSRITPDDIAHHLAYVAGEEGIKADYEALQLIAWSADGGMRDALSMFDQIAGFGNGVITAEGVRSNLNLLDEKEYFSLLGHTLQGRHTKVLTLLDQLLSRGYEGDVIMRGYSNFLRNVLLSQSDETLQLVEAPDLIKQRLRKAGAFSRTSLLWEFLKISTAFGTQYKHNSEKRLALEVAFLQMVEKAPNSPLSNTSDNFDGDSSPSSGTSVGSTSAKGSNVSDGSSVEILSQKDAANNFQSTNGNVAGYPTADLSTSGGQRLKESYPIESTQVNTATLDVAQPTQNPQTASPKEVTQSKSGNETLSGALTAEGDARPHPNRPILNKSFGAMSYNLITGKSGSDTEAPNEEEVSLSRNNPFSLLELKKSWLRYAESLDITHKQLVRNYFQKYFPKATEDPLQFVVAVDSDTIKRQMEEEYPDLKRFVANDLSNDLFRVDIKVVQMKTVVLPQTPQDKFHYMIKKNPNFARISNELHLRPIS